MASPPAPAVIYPVVEEESTAPIEFQPDAPLLLLPWEVLVRICRHVYAWDLFHLGQTCRRLRQVARHRDAWKCVIYPDYWDTVMSMPVYDADLDLMAFLHRDDTMPLMRVAPALDTLRLVGRWPPVDLRQCTNQVREFEVTWRQARFDEPPSPWQLARTLEHYKGHLEVVWLDRMPYGCLLKDIDAIGIKELYIARNLCRVYPGSTKRVTHLKFDGDQIEDFALAEVLRGCRETLKSFRVYAKYVHENKWAEGEPDSEVCQALQLCTNLEVAKIPTWGDVSMLKAFPRLRKLTLCDFQCDAAALDFFRSSPVMRGLEALTLRLGFFAHRGLLQAVAEGCSNLRLLRLIPERCYEKPGLYEAAVDMPRDLHSVLGRLVDLDTLAVYNARLPSPVLDGLAGGALPNLRNLQLHYCGFTPKAKAALDSLRAARPDLAVVEEHSQDAVRESKSKYWVTFTDRCDGDACYPDTDSDSENEDEDPIPGDYHYVGFPIDVYDEVERVDNVDPSDMESDADD